MNLGKKEMTVVVIQSADLSSVPQNIKDEIYSSKTGNIIPRGYIADMGGETVLRHYSYESLKKKETYKEFSELSKLEKKKPNFGTMAHMVMRDAKVKVLTREANSFKYGYSVKSTLSQLENKVKQKAKGADEAQAMIDVVTKWGDAEVKTIKELLKKQPTIAYDKMLSLSNTFRGMPLGQEFPTEIAKLKKDKYFVYLYGLRKQFIRLKASDKVSANSAKYLSTKLQQFMEKSAKNELLVNDAQTMVDSL